VEKWANPWVGHEWIYQCFLDDWWAGGKFYQCLLRRKKYRLMGCIFIFSIAPTSWIQKLSSMRIYEING
jgi:hypothetical protein